MTIAVMFYEGLLRVAAGSLLLLVAASLAVLLTREPARRIRVIQWTLAGLVVLPCLMLVPGYPRLAWLPSIGPAVSDDEGSANAAAKMNAPLVAGLEPNDARHAFVTQEFESLPPAVEWDSQRGDAAFSPSLEPAWAEPTNPPHDGSYLPDDGGPLQMPEEGATRSDANLEAWLQPAEAPLPQSDESPAPSSIDHDTDLANTPRRATYLWLPEDPRVWIVAGYLTGVLVMLFWAAVGLLAVRRLVRAARPAAESCRMLLREIAGPASDRVALLVSTRAAQPCAVRCRKPVIILPERLAAGGDVRSLRWALAHEWSHVERRDLLAWTASGFVRCFFFYQPLVWWLRGQLQLCQDYLADSAAAHADGLPEDYAEFLTTSSFTRPTLAAGLGIGGRISNLRRRVVMLVERHRPLETASPRRWNLVVLPLAIVLVAIAGGLAPRQDAPDESAPTLAGSASEVPGDVADDVAVLADPEQPAASESTDDSTVGTDAPETDSRRKKSNDPKPAKKPVAKPDGPRTIAPGDVLKIEIMDNFYVLNNRGLEVRLMLPPQSTLTVDEAGEISFGSAYGHVHVAGKTLGNAESVVAKSLLIRLPLDELRNLAELKQDEAEKLTRLIDINVRMEFANQRPQPVATYAPTQSPYYVGPVARTPAAHPTRQATPYYPQPRDAAPSWPPSPERAVGPADNVKPATKATTVPSVMPSLEPEPRAAPPRTANIQNRTRIAPGDVLRLEAEPPEAELDRESTVEADGNLALGVRFGRVKVAGLTLSEAEKTIKAAVAQVYRDPSVQVTFVHQAALDDAFFSDVKAAHADRLEQLERLVKKGYASQSTLAEERIRQQLERNKLRSSNDAIESERARHLDELRLLHAQIETLAAEIRHLKRQQMSQHPGGVDPDSLIRAPRDPARPKEPRKALPISDDPPPQNPPTLDPPKSPFEAPAKPEAALPPLKPEKQSSDSTTIPGESF